MKHPEIIERWIDFNDPPPVLEVVPEDDPFGMVRKTNERRMREWKERRRPYIEVYSTLMLVIGLFGAFAWALYTAL